MQLLLLLILTFSAWALSAQASARAEMESNVHELTLRTCIDHARCLKVEAKSAIGGSFPNIYFLTNIAVDLSQIGQPQLIFSKSGILDLHSNILTFSVGGLDQSLDLTTGEHLYFGRVRQ